MFAKMKVLPCVRLKTQITQSFFDSFYYLESDTYYKIRGYYLNKAWVTNPNRIIVTHINIKLIRKHFSDA